MSYTNMALYNKHNAIDSYKSESFKQVSKINGSTRF